MKLFVAIFERVLILPLLLFLVSPLAAQNKVSILRDVLVSPGESSGEVMCYFCNVDVRGTVQGEVLAFWGGVEVSGTVRGDVVVIGGGIQVYSGGRIQEDAVAIAGPVQVDRGGDVDETVTSKAWGHLPGQRQVFWRGALAWLATVVVAALLPLCVIGARRVNRQAEYLREHPWRCVFVGFLLTCVVMGLYALSDRFEKYDYDGVWAIGVTLVWFGLMVAGFAGACSCLARRLSSTNMLLLTLLGALGAGLVSLIPVLGFLFFFFFTWAAMGVVVFTRFRAPD